jgi:hypothetical protein
MVDRETCPKCGLYKPYPEELKGTVSPLYTVISPNGVVGMCWAEPGREFNCRAYEADPGPARVAGLAVEEREATIRGLIGRAEKAEAELAAAVAGLFGPWKVGGCWAWRDHQWFMRHHEDEAEAIAGVAEAVRRAVGGGEG